MTSGWIPRQCRFPTPSGDRRADVAAVVAWRRHVLELLASGTTVPEPTELVRKEFRSRDLPDTTGNPAEAYERILRWRDSFLNYCEKAWDLFPLDDEMPPSLRECATLAKFLQPDDGCDRCDQCLGAPHHLGPCPLFHPDWPPIPPEFAELMMKRRWWEFWKP